MPKRYEPSGGISAGGAPLMLTVGLGAGVAVGFAASFIAQWMFLVLLFPGIMGLAVGVAIALTIAPAKCRSLAAAWIVGAVAGLVCYASYHYFSYERFQGEVAKTFGGSITDKVLEAETGSKGFVGYLNYVAKRGVTISSTHSSSKSGGLNLGTTGTYVLCGIELLIVAGLAPAMAAATVRNKPFCETCGDPYKAEEKAALPAGSESAYERAIESASPNALPADRLSTGPGKNSYVRVRWCDRCQLSDVQFIIYAARAGKKGQVQHVQVYETMLPSDVGRRMLGALRSRGAAERTGDGPPAKNVP